MPRITITLDVPEGTTVTVDQGTGPAPVPTPSVPFPAPSPVPVPTPAPVSGPADFPWPFMGQVKTVDFGGGATRVFSTDVPEGYRGPVTGSIVTASLGTPELSVVDLALGTEPGKGDLGTYSGQSGQAGMSTPTVMAPAGKRVYFTVTARGVWNVRFIHS